MDKWTKSEETLKPDPRYGSKAVSKFINCLMECGKKTVAQRAFYGAMEIVRKKSGDQDPLQLFETALSNVKPALEVRSKRVGGATYQVPMEVAKKRQMALATRWIIDAARAKKGRPIHARLADELLAAVKNEGEAVKRRENVHKMAEANRAFAHYAW